MHNEATKIINASRNRKSVKIAWIHTDMSVFDGWKFYYKTRKNQKKAYSNMDSIVCVSENCKKAAVECIGLPEEKIKVLYNPIDREKIISKAQVQSELPKTASPIICCVGRLAKEKNFTKMIDAHAQLLEKGIDNSLWIVGDGYEKEKLTNQISELKLGNSVKLWGYQNNPYPFIKASTITACSSEYEGLPVVSQESIILGKPVVSCCKVVEETFGELDCGIITDTATIAFADGLQKMLKPENLSYYTANAEKRSLQFDMDAQISEFENLFEMLLKTKD